MKTILALAIFTLCLTVSPIVYAAQDRNAQIKAQMVENYLLWEEAWKLRDAERIISFESPDFISAWGGDPSNASEIDKKAEADKQLRTAMRGIRKVHEVRVKITKLTIEPNRVVILSRTLLDADMPWDEKLHRVSSVSRTRDIWVQYDGIWMLKRIEYKALEIISTQPVTTKNTNQ